MMTTEEIGNELGRDTTMYGDPKEWFPMSVTYQREMKTEVRNQGITNTSTEEPLSTGKFNGKGLSAKEDGNDRYGIS